MLPGQIARECRVSVYDAVRCIQDSTGEEIIMEMTRHTLSQDAICDVKIEIMVQDPCRQSYLTCFSGASWEGQNCTKQYSCKSHEYMNQSAMEGGERDDVANRATCAAF